MKSEGCNRLKNIRTDLSYILRFLLELETIAILSSEKLFRYFNGFTNLHLAFIRDLFFIKAYLILWLFGSVQ